MRETYISEAVKKAVKKNRLIARKKFLNRNSVKITAIKPTNSYDTCILVSYDKDTKKTRMCRAWNPTQDDLIASDWKLLSKKLTNKISN
mgnify:CR=1 FL=1